MGVRLDRREREVSLPATSARTTDNRRLYLHGRQDVSAERFLQQVLTCSHEGIWQVDVDARTIFANELMAEMLGWSASEMLGRPLADFMDDEGRALLEVTFARRRAGVSEIHAFRFKRKDGSDVWIRLDATPLQTRNGRFAGAIAFAEDQTEARRGAARQEAALTKLTETNAELVKSRAELEAHVVGRSAALQLARKSLVSFEQNWRALAENAPNGILVHHGGPIVFANVAAARLLGWTRPEELVGLLPSSLIYPDDRPIWSLRFSDIRPSLHREGPARHRLLGRGGEGVWVESQTRPIVYDERAGVLVTIHDVRSQVAADEHRRHGEVAEAHLRALQEASADALFSVTANGLIVSWNSAASRFFGRGEVEVLGKSVALLCPPEGVGEYDARRDRLLAGEAAVSGPCQGRHRDGQTFEALLISTLIRDRQGRTLGVAHILRPDGTAALGR